MWNPFHVENVVFFSYIIRSIFPIVIFSMLSLSGSEEIFKLNILASLKYHHDFYRISEKNWWESFPLTIFTFQWIIPLPQIMLGTLPLVLYSNKRHGLPVGGSSWSDKISNSRYSPDLFWWGSPIRYFGIGPQIYSWATSFLSGWKNSELNLEPENFHFCNTFWTRKFSGRESIKSTV